MATMRWSLIVLLLIAVPLHADTPPGPVRSTAGIRLDLFGPASMTLQDTTVAGAVQISAHPQKKAVGLAAVYSLLLPGMGELYAGDFSSGTYFLIAEGVLWLTYAAFEVSGNSLREDARTYSVAHAGVNQPGKDDQFFVDVGNFNSVADYNDKKLRDREVSKLYDPALGYAWQWDSDASRLTFRDQRVRSENMYNNRKFVGAAILINHVASAINAARVAIVHNAGLDQALGDLRISGGIMEGPLTSQGVVLTLSKGF